MISSSRLSPHFSGEEPEYEATTGTKLILDNPAATPRQCPEELVPLPHPHCYLDDFYSELCILHPKMKVKKIHVGMD